MYHGTVFVRRYRMFHTLLSFLSICSFAPYRMNCENVATSATGAAVRKHFELSYISVLVVTRYSVSINAAVYGQTSLQRDTEIHQTDSLQQPNCKITLVIKTNPYFFTLTNSQKLHPQIASAVQIFLHITVSLQNHTHPIYPHSKVRLVRF